MRNRIATVIATLLLGSAAFAQAPQPTGTPFSDSKKNLPAELSCEEACRASASTECSNSEHYLDVCLRSCED